MIRRCVGLALASALLGCADLPHTRGPDTTGQVALTFDDGPSAPWTGQILDLLRERGVHATFFVIGVNVERHPELARRIVDEGHEIANHTHHHLATTTAQPGTTLVAEAAGGEDAIAAATGRRARLLRYPVGIMAPNGTRAVAAAVAHDRTLVSYTHRSRDLNHLGSPAGLADRLLAHAAPGAILVLHDGHHTYERCDQSATVAALGRLLDGLAAKGLTAVPVGKLLDVAPYRD